MVTVLISVKTKTYSNSKQTTYTYDAFNRLLMDGETHIKGWATNKAPMSHGDVLNMAKVTGMDSQVETNTIMKAGKSKTDIRECRHEG